MTPSNDVTNTAGVPSPEPPSPEGASPDAGEPRLAPRDAESANGVPAEDSGAAGPAEQTPDATTVSAATVRQAAPLRPAEDRIPRGKFFAIARRHAPIVGVELDDLTFLVSTQDQAVGKSLFIRRQRGEMATLVTAAEALAWVGREDAASKIFVDAGANIGTTTLAAVRRQGFRAGIAIEPAPENFRLLRANVALNDLSDVIDTHRYALSNREGEGSLRLSECNWGDHRVAVQDSAQPEEDRETITVPVTTLDAMVGRGDIAADEVGLLWIDAQGHEGHILGGAREITGRGVPVVAELYPAFLRASGGLDPMIEHLTRDYTHVLDLRRPRSTRGSTDLAFVEIARLPAIVAAYEIEDARKRFTDVLAVRR